MSVGILMPGVWQRELSSLETSGWRAPWRYLFAIPVLFIRQSTMLFPIKLFTGEIKGYGTIFNVTYIELKSYRNSV
jgi:hypothetical protein